MVQKKRVFIPIALLSVAVLLVTSLNILAQNPTGRPTKTPGKTPTKTPGKTPDKPTKTPSRTPPAPTVILTVLSEPFECAVFINGNQRGSTNDEGKFQLEKLALGRYTVEVKKE